MTLIFEEIISKFFVEKWYPALFSIFPEEWGFCFCESFVNKIKAKVLEGECTWTHPHKILKNNCNQNTQNFKMYPVVELNILVFP